jgi:hypothetical protein
MKKQTKVTNIEKLTIGEAREIAALFSGVLASPQTPVKESGPEIAVLVTTAHRGVFFGYTSDIDGETITLRAGRNCLYWSADVKGFVGLATKGPNANCRVGPPANIQLRNITSVVAVSDDAAKAWEASPWKS